ncbi:hypothetical protein KW850_31375 [Bacillus sp. sid0103]|uniref:hypothetical protein n=1 Tax=Bacillus sp. sid0103 TaxID=2856337 RepID=UPI001C449B1C|nr:hypothetical protein [Bacillus sp. sid0103]MBV7509624.1 hypothetical protein [Bacillus sp. sid0103]
MKKNNRAKLIKRNIDPFYSYEIVKEGRAQIGLNIIGYKQQEKSEFIKICEALAGQEVKFPKEETAIQLLKVLYEDDWTIENYENIGYELPNQLERHTVGAYIKLFRKYGILPKELDRIYNPTFDNETGEVFKTHIDPNKYVYYKVYASIGFREEITKVEWLEMHSFIREIRDENINEQLDLCKGDLEAIRAVRQYAAYEAHSACVNEYGGVPRKAISKVLTDKAKVLFSQYFEERKIQMEITRIDNHGFGTREKPSALVSKEKRLYKVTKTDEQEKAEKSLKKEFKPIDMNKLFEKIL